MFCYLRRLISRQLGTNPRPRSRPIMRRARPYLETLETRAVPSTTPFINGSNQLVIDGTEQNDVVKVERSAGELEVKFNGQRFDFAAASVTEIVFNGNGGDDYFINRTGLRVIADGGTGSDTIIGGRGDDSLSGGDDDDDLRGGRGDDDVSGEGGDDRVNGGRGSDNCSGGSGNDDVLGSRGSDNVWGDDDDDYCDGGKGSDNIDGGTGEDRCNGDDDDSIEGSEGNELKALLTGSGDDKGEAEFEQESSTNKFKVELEHLSANTTYEVFLNDGTDPVMRLTTDSLGQAKKVQLNVSFAIEVDNTLTVKDTAGNVVLQGAFVVDSTGDGGGDDTGDDSGVELVAALTGDGDDKGEAEFESEDSGTRFKVEIEHLPADTEYFVYLNDGTDPVTTLTTNSEGRAEKMLFGISFDVADGMTLTVKDAGGNIILEGDFEVSTDV